MDFGIISTALFAIVFVVSFFIKVPQIRAIMMAISLCLIILSRLSVILYTQANKLYLKKTPEAFRKAKKKYEKAIKLGLPTTYLVACGSMLIQRGELELGKLALEKALKKNSRDKKLNQIARVSLSMYYWKSGNLDRAIDLCKEVLSEGYIDQNVLINLSTYLLEKGDIDSFNEYAKSYSKNEKLMKSPVLVDYSAVSHILKGEWKKASTLLSRLFDDGDYSFADPYLHLAQVKMHYGNVKEAIEILRRAKEECNLAEESTISEELIDKIIRALENDEMKLSFMSDAELDPLSLINGKMPKKSGKLVTFEADKSEPLKKKEEREEKVEEANTELNDDDEEWIKNHQ